MKALSIAPVVSPFRLKGWIRIMPIISVRKVLSRTIELSVATEPDRLPSSKLLNYFVLALTFLYLTILVTGCWAVVHMFWQWTTDTCLKGFPMS